MTFNEYQEKARRTAIYPEGWVYPALGLCGEAGEVAEKLKKYIRDGKTCSEVREELIKELGDVLWYIANLAYEFEISLEEIAEKNIEKLLSRKERNKLHGNGDDR
ncbi:nucleoside triphosphate pyrophosphohydrolase family protein [Thermodesulfovibrio sp. 3907-1M]|uniref:Nucleoside triphosphate pyrophosphohydrolase family protein n=1 Tax=Thermodesulfovibrio autotrophicus TaxID=3118333 RepID=A0AAU8GZY6_9BACT